MLHRPISFGLLPANIQIIRLKTKKTERNFEYFFVFGIAIT